MAEASSRPISDLLGDARRIALVGLAKNTGKTQTLGAILAEHAAAGRTIGVTSIGRDGEAHDVIDERIDKPPIELQAGSLVASTDALLRSSRLAHERLSQTGIRTPLGEVVIARLSEPGAIEVAGPSGADDVRAVSEQMAALGAEQVLIDGAVDRRAASSPAIADGLVIATGAVLSQEIEQVVARTKDAADLVRLPRSRGADGPIVQASRAATAGPDVGRLAVGRRLALSAEPAQVAELLEEHPRAHTLTVEGAVSERFLEALLAARRQRAGRELRVIAEDPTKVFLSRRGPSWYAKAGLSIEVVRTIDLRAITVNPVAPRSHSFSSELLRELVQRAIPDVPVLDVLDPRYVALAK